VKEANFERDKKQTGFFFSPFTLPLGELCWWRRINFRVSLSFFPSFSLLSSLLSSSLTYIAKVVHRQYCKEVGSGENGGLECSQILGE